MFSVQKPAALDGARAGHSLYRTHRFRQTCPSQMPSFTTQRRVAHSAVQMFDLVADVDSYPQFLPMCTGLTVKSRSIDAQGRDVLVADMQVGYKAIRERFASRVTLDRGSLEILVEYIDGPFSHLRNRWNFVDMPSTERPASRVDFFIDYQFRSRLLGMLMGSMFDIAFRKFTTAFETRADQIYGRGNS